MGGKWDDPLEPLGRVHITNLLMDPYERQWGDVNRQYSEHKQWVMTPLLGVLEQHFATFKDFPIRQLGLSTRGAETVAGIQSQILKLQQGGR